MMAVHQFHHILTKFFVVVIRFEYKKKQPHSGTTSGGIESFILSFCLFSKSLLLSHKIEFSVEMSKVFHHRFTIFDFFSLQVFLSLSLSTTHSKVRRQLFISIPSGDGLSVNILMSLCLGVVVRVTFFPHKLCTQVCCLLKFCLCTFFHQNRFKYANAKFCAQQ